MTSDLKAQLRALVDRVDDLEPAALVGQLEALKYTVWVSAVHPAPTPTPAGRGLDVAAVQARTGMSRGWLYREARAGRLPFARRIGRRVVFDEIALGRWLANRRPR